MTDGCRLPVTAHLGAAADLAGLKYEQAKTEDECARATAALGPPQGEGPLLGWNITETPRDQRVACPPPERKQHRHKSLRTPQPRHMARLSCGEYRLALKKKQKTLRTAARPPSPRPAVTRPRRAPSKRRLNYSRSNAGRGRSLVPCRVSVSPNRTPAWPAPVPFGEWRQRGFGTQRKGDVKSNSNYIP